MVDHNKAIMGLFHLAQNKCHLKKEKDKTQQK